MCGTIHQSSCVCVWNKQQSTERTLLYTTPWLRVCTKRQLTYVSRGCISWYGLRVQSEGHKSLSDKRNPGGSDKHICNVKGTVYKCKMYKLTSVQVFKCTIYKCTMYKFTSVQSIEWSANGKCFSFFLWSGGTAPTPLIKWNAPWTGRKVHGEWYMVKGTRWKEHCAR